MPQTLKPDLSVLRTQSERGAGGMLAAMGAFITRLKARAAARQLYEMDDRMLADVGLTRADVERAFDSPWYADPSADLSRARNTRMTNRFNDGRRRV